VLVNAGGPPPGDALEVADDDWAGAFRLLIGGPITLLRALVPQLEDEGGSVLFVARRRCASRSRSWTRRTCSVQAWPRWSRCSHASSRRSSA
jgi:NAD(P)-dependent dehydrogenase (short-subunit alcohol dehydrogenase family)